MNYPSELGAGREAAHGCCHHQHDPEEGAPDACEKQGTCCQRQRDQPGLELSL
ncbi:uncharacterized protein METZ01_LOCUS20160 [marine metagenome]|uniref:Uncharacterized protein n=1 Tax=marine metagenome TaxID=408172 RepID=A0A381PJV8_9ZZZZ